MTSSIQMMTLICHIAGFIIVFAYPLVILRPIIRLTKSNANPTTRARFTISDLLSLMFLIQAPVALLYGGSTRGRTIPNPMTMIIMSLAFLMSFVIWLAGLRAANQLGITNQLKRIVAIGFTLPAASTGGLFVGFLVAQIPRVVSRPVSMAETAPMMVGWFIAAVVFTLLVRYSVRWIVRDSAVDQVVGTPTKT